MHQLSISDQNQVRLQRVVLIQIGDHFCNPEFKCLHLKNPGVEQLKEGLYRYRTTKEILIEMFDLSQNYAAFEDWLYAKLFAEIQECLRLH